MDDLFQSKAFGGLGVRGGGGRVETWVQFQPHSQNT